MNASQALRGYLPKDPDNDGPIGIADSADLRAVLDENERLRTGLGDEGIPDADD